MGAALGEFVGTHFLADDVVRDKVTGAEVTRRGGEWLAPPTTPSEWPASWEGRCAA